MPTFQPTVYTPPPVLTRHPSEHPVPTFQHTIYEEPIFHPGNMGAYDRVHDLQEKYDEM